MALSSRLHLLSQVDDLKLEALLLPSPSSLGRELKLSIKETFFFKAGYFKNLLAYHKEDLL